MVNALQASIKAAAVGGIFVIWANITVESFKMIWHIVNTSPDNWGLAVKRSVACKNCNVIFDDDGDVN